MKVTKRRIIDFRPIIDRVSDMRSAGWKDSDIKVTLKKEFKIKSTSAHKAMTLQKKERENEEEEAEKAKQPPPATPSDVASPKDRKSPREEPVVFNWRDPTGGFSFDVRAILLEAPLVNGKLDMSQVLFVASDVANILGYREANTMIRLLNHTFVKGPHKVWTHGGQQQMQVITLHGLVEAVQRCTKPEAQKFQEWAINTVVARLTGTPYQQEIPSGEPDRIERMEKVLGATVGLVYGVAAKSKELEVYSVQTRSVQSDMVDDFGYLLLTTARMNEEIEGLKQAVSALAKAVTDSPTRLYVPDNITKVGIDKDAGFRLNREIERFIRIVYPPTNGVSHPQERSANSWLKGDVKSHLGLRAEKKTLTRANAEQAIKGFDFLLTEGQKRYGLLHQGFFEQKAVIESAVAAWKKGSSV